MSSDMEANTYTNDCDGFDCHDETFQDKDYKVQMMRCMNK